jgi:hypothetical protein
MSKYNVYKLAAFALEETFRILGYKNKKVYNIINEEETALLQVKLQKIVRKINTDGLSALQNQNAVLF